tara:strand:- start:3068 stop:3640 length:573 start_codon:yes stop_codon:yes gene_type:complete
MNYNMPVDNNPKVEDEDGHMKTEKNIRRQAITEGLGGLSRFQIVRDAYPHAYREARETFEQKHPKNLTHYELNNKWKKLSEHKRMEMVLKKFRQIGKNKDLKFTEDDIEKLKIYSKLPINMTENNKENRIRKMYNSDPSQIKKTPDLIRDIYHDIRGKDKAEDEERPGHKINTVPETNTENIIQTNTNTI